MIRQQAFDNSFQANIISSHENGKILLVNKATCKLFGYSEKELQALSMEIIFDSYENRFKKIFKAPSKKIGSLAYLTAINKNGKQIPCEITSAIFLDDTGKEKVITTISDLSLVILNQKYIDIEKEKLVIDNINIAISKQKCIDAKNEKLVSDNINIAISKQKNIDAKNEKLVADNISIAKSKQKYTDIKNEKLVTDNINIAISKQKNIDATKELIKAKQIIEARENARSIEKAEIGRELHDNVSQLLGASTMYLQAGIRGGINSKMYLDRSSQYVLSAIAEIRNLSKSLVTNTIKNIGLFHAIENISDDIMEVNSLKIACYQSNLLEDRLDDKFKLNLFRIVQEQLNNIIKHANASKVNISLSQDINTISLSIADNGIGFDTLKTSSGIGLENIKNRAAAYSGSAHFISHPDKGCVLGITFPNLSLIYNEEE